MVSLLLDCAYGCWTYDHIGSNPEENVDDVGVLQVPSTWALVVDDPQSIVIFFLLLKHPDVDDNNKIRCLRIIANIIMVRRGIFSCEERRLIFLGYVLLLVSELMSNEKC